MFIPQLQKQEHKDQEKNQKKHESLLNFENRKSRNVKFSASMSSQLDPSKAVAAAQPDDPSVLKKPRFLAKAQAKRGANESAKKKTQKTLSPKALSRLSNQPDDAKDTANGGAQTKISPNKDFFQEGQEKEVRLDIPETRRSEFLPATSEGENITSVASAPPEYDRIFQIDLKSTYNWDLGSDVHAINPSFIPGVVAIACFCFCSFLYVIVLLKKHQSNLSTMPHVRVTPALLFLNFLLGSASLVKILLYNFFIDDILVLDFAVSLLLPIWTAVYFYRGYFLIVKKESDLGIFLCTVENSFHSVLEHTACINRFDFALLYFLGYRMLDQPVGKLKAQVIALSLKRSILGLGFLFFLVAIFLGGLFAMRYISVDLLPEIIILNVIRGTRIAMLLIFSSMMVYFDCRFREIIDILGIAREQRMFSRPAIIASLAHVAVTVLAMFRIAVAFRVSSILFVDLEGYTICLIHILMPVMGFFAVNFSKWPGRKEKPHEENSNMTNRIDEIRSNTRMWLRYKHFLVQRNFLTRALFLGEMNQQDYRTSKSPRMICTTANDIFDVFVDPKSPYAIGLDKEKIEQLEKLKTASKLRHWTFMRIFEDISVDLVRNAKRADQANTLPIVSPLYICILAKNSKLMFTTWWSTRLQKSKRSCDIVKRVLGCVQNSSLTKD